MILRQINPAYKLANRNDQCDAASMGDPSVSVALCTFNGARWITEQLQSILGQTRKPCQIVVCDDASTDDTVGIVRQIAALTPVPFHIQVNPRNLGIAGNFQQALSLCRGELIALSDQDDVWRPEKLEVLANALQAQPAAAYAICNARLVDWQGTPMGYDLWDLHQLTPQREAALAGDDSMELLTLANFATGATMLFRRCWLPQILPVSPNWIHDGWISLMLSAFARCVPVRRTLVDYRQHPGQKVGACRRSELRKLVWQRVMNREFYQRESIRWADAYAFLSARRSLMRRESDLTWVRRRAMFDRDRYELRTAGELRWPLVADHALAGDYHRYGLGWLSAGVDLMIHG